MTALQPLGTLQRTIVLRPSQVTSPDAVLDSVTAALRNRGHGVKRLGGYRLEFHTRGSTPVSFRAADDPRVIAGGSVQLDPAGRLHVELRYSPAFLGWPFGLAALVVWFPLSATARAAILAALASIAGFNAWKASRSYLGHISDAAFSSRQPPAGARRQP